VSNVTKMKEMFMNACAFNQNLSRWNLRNDIYCREMFYGAYSLKPEFKPNF